MCSLPQYLYSGKGSRTRSGATHLNLPDAGVEIDEDIEKLGEQIEIFGSCL